MPSPALPALLLRSFKGLAVVSGLLLLSACGSNAPTPAPPAVTLAPASVTLDPGGRAQFSARAINCFGQVVWQVDEPGGGTITSGGLYTAPQAPGVFHVRVFALCDPAASAVSTVTVLETPEVPVIFAAATAAPGSDQVAWAQAREGDRCQWTITGGTAQGPLDGPVLAYTAGPAGSVVLGFSSTNGVRTVSANPFTQTITAPQASGDLAVPVLDVPAWITALQAGTAQVHDPVAGVTYTWTITGGTFPSNQAQVTGSSVAFTAGTGSPAPQVLLVCTASNGSGSVTVPAAVAIAPEPRVPDILVPGVFATGSGPVRADVVAPEPGLHYLWTIQGGTFLDGSTTASGPSVNVDGSGAGTLTLTCQARNAAGQLSPVQTATLQGVPPGQQPVITLGRYWTEGMAGLTATASREGGATVAFLWQIQGGTFQDGASTARGTSVTLDASTAGTRILACSALDANGQETPATLAAVDIVPAPAIESFRVATGHQLYLGDDALLIAQFSGGTATVDQGVGPVASGQPFQVSPLAETYTLSVRNPAGSTLSQTLQPPVQKVTTAITEFGAAVPVVSYGEPVELAWRLEGVPTRLDLNLAGSDGLLWPRSVLGQSTYPLVPSRRQTYTLTSQDPLGTASQSFQVASRGVEVLAGWPGPDPLAFLDGPTAQAAWNHVTGVAADDQGRVWFTEGADATLRRIDADGTVSVVAGLRGNPDDGLSPAGSLRFWEPKGLSVGADGTVRVADTLTHTIKGVGLDGVTSLQAGLPGVPGTADGPPETHPTLSLPLDIATHKATDISFIAEANGSVRMMGPNGTLRLISHDVANPAGIAVDPEGNVYVSDAAAGKVYRLTPTLPLSMASTFTSEVLIQNLVEPRGLAVDVNGMNRSLLVVESGANRIRSCGVRGLGSGVLDASILLVVVNPQGTAGHVDGTALAARFRRPSRVAVAADHGLLVTDQDETVLRFISSDHATVTTLGRPAHSATPWGSADGKGTQARFFLPLGVVEDSHGNLFVADALNHTIRRIAPDGSVTTFAGRAGAPGNQDGVGSAARFNLPSHLAVDRLDNLYVSEPTQSRIRRITPAGEVTTWIGVGLDTPMGLAVNPQGRLFIADYGSGRILDADPDGNLDPEPLATDVQVQHLTLDAQGTLFALSPGRRNIYRFDPPKEVGGAWNFDWFLQDWLRGAQDNPADEMAQLDDPVGIAPDGNGGLYVADRQSRLVRRIRPDGSVTTVAGRYPYGDVANGPIQGGLPELLGLAVTAQGDLVLTGANAVLIVTAP